MIILDALKVKDDPEYRILPNNPYYHCMEFTFQGKTYAMAFQPDWYGEHVRQFAIDGKMDTDVEDKYSQGQKITFCESNSLCGVRAFEQGSIVYEYLLKPLGLELIKRTGYQNTWYQGMFKRFCEKNAIEYKEWVY